MQTRMKGKAGQHMRTALPACGSSLHGPGTTFLTGGTETPLAHLQGHL